jgi:hypothetical protein
MLLIKFYVIDKTNVTEGLKYGPVKCKRATFGKHLSTAWLQLLNDGHVETKRILLLPAKRRGTARSGAFVRGCHALVAGTVDFLVAMREVTFASKDVVK